ncbi:UNVERIFIED_CONTAM: Furcatin hydrolase [Sesamum angustifolium]|uniref:Furcatin hydrolase n=1 Tax=Sesamum angustifolium TaxID=2727405 RepID=A0AAW2N8G9_9LAMI
MEGIAFYNNVFNELLANCITPFVTLFHWDVPQALEDEYLGFLSPLIVDDFKDFAELCFKEFGDRIKHLITVNEPSAFAASGYDGGSIGSIAPGRCSSRDVCAQGNSPTEPYIVVHHLLLAHAAATKLYKEKYQPIQKGKVGIVVVTDWMVPYSSHELDVKAAQRALDFVYGWIMNPLVYGEYPRIMQCLVGNRLPKFTKEQAAMTALKYHFVYPKGLHDLLVYTKKKYNNPTIYIAETGMSDGNNPINQAIEDLQRVDFYDSHIRAVHQAIK